MPRGKRESVLDYLKETKKQPLKLSKQESKRQNNILDYYGFGKKDMEKAVEQAVSELKEEVEDGTQVKPRIIPETSEPTPEPSGPDLRQLVDEIKSALKQGFENNQLPSGETTELQEALITELRKLGTIAVPAPIVEVTTPEQPAVKPIKRVIATNIQRDDNGNVAGAEFEVKR